MSRTPPAARPTTPPAVASEEARSWTLTIHPPGGRVRSVNDDHRAHWKAVARHRREVRGQTRLLTHAAHIPTLPRAHVQVTVHLHGWRHADATNYPGGATVKAALDALVDANVVPSDRPEHLDVAMPVLAPVGKGQVPRVVLTVTELPPVTVAAAASAAGLAGIDPSGGGRR